MVLVRLQLPHIGRRRRRLRPQAAPARGRPPPPRPEAPGQGLNSIRLFKILTKIFTKPKFDMETYSVFESFEDNAAQE